MIAHLDHEISILFDIIQENTNERLKLRKSFCKILENAEYYENLTLINWNLCTNGSNTNGGTDFGIH